LKSALAFNYLFSSCFAKPINLSLNMNGAANAVTSNIEMIMREIRKIFFNIEIWIQGTEDY